MTKPTLESIAGMKHIQAAQGTGVYKIREIFYSIQGEGSDAGKAAVFVRFSHCNLACTWCDTDYDHGDWMTVTQVVDEISRLVREFIPVLGRLPIIVFTGGEPSLQVDRNLTWHLRDRGYRLTMETNGIKWTKDMAYMDTITVSPKTPYGWWSAAGLSPRETEQLVMKVVYDPSNPEFNEILHRASRATCRERYLQPLEDQATKATNVTDVVDYVKRHPQWRLSLQTHKILGLR